MSRYRQTMREALQEVVSENETFDEAVKWEVKIAGLPLFYVDGKSRGAVRQVLRKMLKRPDDIASIERTTSTELKKIRRGQAQGNEPGESNEEVEDEFDYKAKKGAIAAPGSGSIAKARKPKATDVNKSIEQQMKDALKEQIKDAIKEKSTIDADQVVNMIQFGHPFKVVDEEIPPELPGPETRRYANVSNAVVDKADKKSNKAMAKAEKDTLVPTQTKEGEQYPAGGVTDDSGYTRYPSTGNWAGIKGKTYKKNLAKAQAKDKRDQDKDPVGKQHEDIQKIEKDYNWLAKHRQKEREALVKAVLGSKKQQALAKKQAAKKKVDEVAPPGWGHTKAEKEKTKPDKPKSKIGGSAHEFQKDLDSGKFKGLPGDKTNKDKKASMFKLMWSMQDKGDKPHYKPGEKDVLKKKYKNEAADTWHPDPKKDKVTKHQARLLPTSPKKPITKPRKSNVDFKDLRPQFGEDGQDLPGLGPKKKSVRTSKRVGQIYTGAQVSGEETLLDSAKRYLNETADWNTAFKSAAQSRPAMKYKDAVSFIDTAGLNSTEKRSALKAAKKWLR